MKTGGNIVAGSWTEAIRQLGNAVPVKQAPVIGGHLYERLRLVTVH